MQQVKNLLIKKTISEPHPPIAPFKASVEATDQVLEELRLWARKHPGYNMYTGKYLTPDLTPRPYKNIAEIQSKLGLSGTDPVGAFALNMVAARGPILGAIGKRLKWTGRISKYNSTWDSIKSTAELAAEYYGKFKKNHPFLDAILPF